MTTAEVLQFIESQDVLQVDVRFTDLLGLVHQVTFPANRVSERSLGIGFGEHAR
ncbi:MAG: hypothetical protein LAP61_22700 [Acidobacteriia bacterium]|nr:hypothetical protein [Terriglobia bacterium]